jgi:hypothetical protein
VAETNLLQKFLTNITLLWLVPEAGDIRFCIKESFEATSPDRRFARPRETDQLSWLLPLGHPMLADQDIARIAGELYLEQTGLEEPWVLSSDTGRVRCVSAQSFLVQNWCCARLVVGLNERQPYRPNVVVLGGMHGQPADHDRPRYFW